MTEGFLVRPGNLCMKALAFMPDNHPVCQFIAESAWSRSERNDSFPGSAERLARR